MQVNEGGYASFVEAGAGVTGSSCRTLLSIFCTKGTVRVTVFDQPFSTQAASRLAFRSVRSLKAQMW